MRILFIITRSAPIGGAQIHVRDLASQLQLDGHEVRVLIGSEGSVPNTFTAGLQASGVQFAQVPHFMQPIRPAADVHAYRELRKQIAQFKPDVISTHSSKAGVLGRLAARKFRIPTLFTAHGWAFADGVSSKHAAVYRIVERAMARFAAKIITVSEADRQLALKHRIAPSDRLITIHNGMPDNAPNLRATPEASPVRLIMIARFQPQKDHPLLFSSLAKLTHLPWTLSLIGDGPLQPTYERTVNELGIADRITFLGERADVAEQLAESSVFLLISNWEGFPRSILEAMRAGLPVVASDVGGVRESVHDGTTGFLIPRGDGETLTERLTTIITDERVRLAFGNAGRERFAAQFTFEQMYTQTTNIYHKLVP